MAHARTFQPAFVTDMSRLRTEPSFYCDPPPSSILRSRYRVLFCPRLFDCGAGSLRSPAFNPVFLRGKSVGQPRPPATLAAQIESPRLKLFQVPGVAGSSKWHWPTASNAFEEENMDERIVVALSMHSSNLLKPASDEYRFERAETRGTAPNSESIELPIPTGTYCIPQVLTARAQSV